MNILFVKSRMPEKGKGIPNLISAPLGFLYLIGMIEQERPGKDAYQILDLRLSTVDFSNAITHLDNFVPDMVAISSFSREAPAAVQFVSEVKKKYPRTTILLGGPYVTSEKQAVFRSDAVDFAIQSEGEVPFIEFLEYLEGKCRADEIQNLIYRENGQARMNPVRPYIEKLDSLPLPYWPAIDLSAYSGANRLWGFTFHAPILTSRGCPLECKYCCHEMGKVFRGHSPERVVMELEQLIQAKGVQVVEVLDENFNFDGERAERICDLISEKKMKIHLTFPNGVRLDFLTERLIDKMKAAGTIHVAAPFDTGSPDMQRRLKKRLDLEKSEEMTRYMIKKNIFTVGYFVVGLPGETIADFRQTLELSSRLPFHIIRFFKGVVFPGTDIAEEVGNLPDPLIEPDRYDYDGAGFGSEQITTDMINKAKRLNYFRLLNPFHLRRIWCAYPYRLRLFCWAMKTLWSRILHDHNREEMVPGDYGNVSA